MTRLKTICSGGSRLLFLSLLLVCVETFAESGDILGFAGNLFTEEDYYRAITEYKRYLFDNPSGEHAEDAQLMIGLCYLRGEKYEAAESVFVDLKNAAYGTKAGENAAFLYAESVYAQEQYAVAVDAYREFQQSYPNSALGDMAKLKASWSCLQLGQKEYAGKEADKISKKSRIYDSAVVLGGAAREMEDLPQKSSKLAAAMSAVLPGAGQVYTHHPRDAALAFIINLALAYGAFEAIDNGEYVTGGLFGFVGFSFYAGNIYNAANNAHKYNTHLREKFFENTKIRAGLIAIDESRQEFLPGVVYQIRF